MPGSGFARTVVKALTSLMFGLMSGWFVGGIVFLAVAVVYAVLSGYLGLPGPVVVSTQILAATAVAVPGTHYVRVLGEEPQDVPSARPLSAPLLYAAAVVGVVPVFLLSLLIGAMASGVACVTGIAVAWFAEGRVLRRSGVGDGGYRRRVLRAGIIFLVIYGPPTLAAIVWSLSS